MGTSSQSAKDVAARLADLGSQRWRGAARLIRRLDKNLDVDDDTGLPVLVPDRSWSTTERLTLRLAEAIVDGDLGLAAERYDDGQWRALLAALDVVRDELPRRSKRLS